MPKVIVVRPNITEQEKQERLRNLENVLSTLLKCKVTIKEKDQKNAVVDIKEQWHMALFDFIAVLKAFDVFGGIKTDKPEAFCIKEDTHCWNQWVPINLAD